VQSSFTLAHNARTLLEMIEKFYAIATIFVEINTALLRVKRK